MKGTDEDVETVLEFDTGSPISKWESQSAGVMYSTNNP